MKFLRNFLRKLKYNAYFYSTKKANLKYLVRSNFSNKLILTSLMEKYGSDKGGFQKVHNFSDFYSQIFTNREQIKKILEVGLGTSNIKIASNMGSEGKPLASLRAWRDFFFNAEIFGADIDKNVLINENRIKTFYVDQTKKESIEEMWKNISHNDFDIIIDDGLHTFEANTCLFENSITFLSSSGVYIIEDVYRKQIKWYEDYFNKLGFNYSVVDIYHEKNISNNCLILINKN